MQIHRRGTKQYDDALAALSRRGDADLERVEPEVRAILGAVRARGDAALRELTERFEQRALDRIVLDRDAIVDGASSLDSTIVRALEQAGERIRRYHEHQREPGFRYEEDGISLGLRVRPVKAAGVYAPGGKARYPSSVLMAAI